MGDVQMLFPMEPKEFWQKLKAIVEQVIIEQVGQNQKPGTSVNTEQKPLLKVSEICTLFKISKPTVYEWMNQGKLPSIKIESRRFFKWEDVERLIDQGRSQSNTER